MKLTQAKNAVESKPKDLKKKKNETSVTFRKEKRKRNTKVSLRNLPKIAEPIEAEGPKKEINETLLTFLIQ